MDANGIKAVQQALRDRGFDPGPIDGIWGRKTIAAVREFQRDVGIAVDGIYGPQTAQRLFPLAQKAKYDAPWLSEAARLLMTRQVPGKGDNEVIIDMATRLDIPYANDEVPWCGLFVGHCISATLPDEPLPAGLLSARSWLKLGGATTPRLGAVMVFWRGSKTSWEGHVGFYAGEHGSNYFILGGNQGDAVTYTWMPRDKLLEARWPTTAKALEDGARIVDVGPDAAGTFSASLS